MKYKDIFIGVLIGLVIAFGLFIVFGKSSISLGGSTSDDWNVGGELTVSGTGESAFAGNLVADGGFILGGNLDIGETASFSLTAAQVCNDNWLTANPNGTFIADGTEGASVSMPTQEALIADCLSSEGDIKEVYLDNTATASARNFDYLVPGTDSIKYASTQRSDFSTVTTNLIRFTNYDGTSVSTVIDVFEGMASDTN